MKHEVIQPFKGVIEGVEITGEKTYDILVETLSLIEKEGYTVDKEMVRELKKDIETTPEKLWEDIDVKEDGSIDFVSKHEYGIRHESFYNRLIEERSDDELREKLQKDYQEYLKKQERNC